MNSSMRMLATLFFLQSCRTAGSVEDGLIRKRGAKSAALVVDAEGDVAVDQSGAIALEKSSVGESHYALMQADQLLSEIKKMVTSEEVHDPNNSKIKVIQDIVNDELLPKLQSTRDTEAKELKSVHDYINTCNAQSTKSQKNTSDTIEKNRRECPLRA
jgi:hypothetical protein